jgi:Glycosyl transferase family 2
VNVAVVTFVYNEAINLPIWLRYYGKLFGEKSLFVIDHSSYDGSTRDLQWASKLLIPRDALEERKRCVFMASFQKALLEYFHTVIYTDCDEILVADPAKYKDLGDYLLRNDFEYVMPIGLDVQHLPGIEQPLDLSRPILAQRQYCQFNIGMCKPLISRVPIVWETGFHASDKPARPDDRLFLFHLKLMDFDIAMERVKFTREMGWSERSVAAGHGAHARYDDEKFKREFFLDPQNFMKTQGLSEFHFGSEVARIEEETVERSGFYWPPQIPRKIMAIPDRFRNIF